MLENKEQDPQGFDFDHFNRKFERQQKRKLDKIPFDGGKRMHRVGKKEKWHFDPDDLFDDDEGL